jgi:tRNA (guanine37-N1)-methyltransferase
VICSILTLFPEIIEVYTRAGVIGKARERGLIDVRAVQIREFATDRHRTVDDTPYGGGAGMIMKADVVHRAITYAGEHLHRGEVRIILTSPQGRRLTHAVAQEIATLKDVCILCGHYGGVDERVRSHMVHDEVSLGDFVLTGGELPALAILDAVARFVPDVLGNEESAQADSFADGLLGPPTYTRPPDFMGWAVPEELLSGNHAQIAAWRRREKLRDTLLRRPDLLARAPLEPKDIKYLNTLGYTGKET